MYLQEKLDSCVKTNIDGMGSPAIKYGDSVCYVQHVDSGLWLTYQSVDAKSSRVGTTQKKVFHSNDQNDCPIGIDPCANHHEYLSAGHFAQ